MIGRGRAIRVAVLVTVIVTTVLQIHKFRISENSSLGVVWSKESSESLLDFTSTYNFALTDAFSEPYEDSTHHDSTEDQMNLHVQSDDLDYFAENSTRGNVFSHKFEVESATVKNIDPSPASQSNLSVLYEESKDIFNLLPEKYLPDYKSFCWYDDREDFQCLASVYLAGLSKCGTTDLFSKLMWHPELTTQSHHKLLSDGNSSEKEFHYWTRGRVGRPRDFLENPRVAPPVMPFSEFLAGSGSERVRNFKEIRIVDGTPSLLWDLSGWETRYPGFENPPYSNADLIYAVTPDAKILAILRNPVDRLFSEYLFFWRTRRMRNEVRTPQSFHLDVLRETRKFNRCLTGNSLRHCCYSSGYSKRLRVALGVYVCYVRDFKKVFDDKLLVVTLNEYHSFPVETLSRIFSHIGVSLTNLEDLEHFIKSSVALNRGNEVLMEVGEMLDETRELLNEFYRPYNSELASLLGDSKFIFV